MPEQKSELERRILTNAPQNMRLESPAFQAGQNIPETYTAFGRDVSPPLKWEDVPRGTQAIAILVDDPDAPKGIFTHWSVWNLPGNVKELEKDADVRSAGGHQGTNDFGNVGWNGPKPPSGTHRYFFRVFALDGRLDLNEGAKPEEVWNALDGRVLGWGELMGKFQRP